MAADMNVLEFLLSLATTTIASADAASISVVSAGRHETLTATSESCRIVDEVQHRTVLATPLSAGGRTFGVLNMYSMSDATFGPGDLERAQQFADCIAAVLADTEALTAATEQNGQMVEALVTRSMIGQAQGLIMARHGITADGAFDMLRTRSQRTNRKLREVAQEVVDEAESVARRPAAG